MPTSFKTMKEFAAETHPAPAALEDKQVYANLAGFGGLLDVLLSGMAQALPEFKPNWRRSEGNLKFIMADDTFMSVRILHTAHRPNKKYTCDSDHDGLAVGLRANLTDLETRYLTEHNLLNLPARLKERPFLAKGMEKDVEWHYYRLSSVDDIHALFKKG